MSLRSVQIDPGKSPVIDLRKLLIRGGKVISRIQIEGMAIIDSLSIELSDGFNVITGETGAGKSILIKALDFLTGARASGETVRTGVDTASVMAEFWVESEHTVGVLLKDLGIPFDPSQEGFPVLIRRQVTSKGRSQGWINDVPVTRQTLRDVGRLLVDIFAQHENQRLMHENEHLYYLDHFLADPKPRARLAELHHRAWEILKSLRETVDEFKKGLTSRDYLSFRLEELNKFDPQTEDFQHVSLVAGASGKSLKVKERLMASLACLENEELSVASAVRESARELNGVGAGIDVSTFLSRLAAVAEELDDLHYELTKLSDSVEVNEEDLEAAQSRLFGYQELFRKHFVRDMEELLEVQAKLEGDLSLLDSAASTVKAQLKTLNQITQEMLSVGMKLSAARRQAARQASSRVESELKDLAMKGASFQVEFLPVQRAIPVLEVGNIDESLESLWVESAQRLSECTEAGVEKARFCLSANPGEAAQPLAKVASGGEMSRILLALKKALAADAQTCVLVFDEIDTGVSGRVADVVGKKLRELSQTFQVICISHLPQVAVYADEHFLVEKRKVKDRTESQIVHLTPKQSTQEIARLLSGAEVSPSSLQNAKTLIAKARGKKSLSESRV